jgi:tetratricopeptide (TPR) repeat protein
VEDETEKPKDEQSRITIGVAYVQAVEFFKAGKYNKADILCTSILNSAPNYVDAINLLGVVAQKVNRHDMASELFLRGIKCDPSLSILYYNLSVSLCYLGRIQEAVQFLHTALEKDPGNTINSISSDITKISPALHNKWTQYIKNSSITIQPKSIVKPDDIVFTMGSCFAREIRFELERLGVEVGPDYQSIPNDLDCFVIDKLPRKQHTSHFNTFTMRQEFERMNGQWTQSPDDYWKTKRDPTGLGHRYQDPYKTMTFAKSPEELSRAVALVNSAIEYSARRARVFFFTLGMAEVFRKLDNNLVANQKPAYLGGGGESETELYFSSFADNMNNLEVIRQIIKQFNADAHIIVTVSPVPLERTFSGRDVLIANTEGKSLLRAVAGEFSRKHDDVTYFPSYEIVSMLGDKAYERYDHRHVNHQTVNAIIKSFAKAHVNKPDV